MQKSRTTLLFILGAYLVFIAPTLVTSLQIENSVVDREKLFHNKRDLVRVEHIKDVSSKAHDDKSSVITYQQIDQAPKAISDEDSQESRLYEIKVDGLDDAVSNSTLLLSSTSSKDHCEENSSSSLPSWKIDKGTSEGKIRLRINYAKRLVGKTLFLCVRNEAATIFRHMGESSRFLIKG